MVRLALRSALSDRASEDRVALIDSFTWDEPKTKDAIAALTALGLEGKVLVVLGDEDFNAALSFRNLSQITMIAAGEINAYDILATDWVLFTDETLPTANSTKESA